MPDAPKVDKRLEALLRASTESVRNEEDDMLFKKLFPPMLDPSALASEGHIRAVLSFKGKVFFPRIAYDMIFEKEDLDGFDTLARYFEWTRATQPRSKGLVFELRPFLVPYRRLPQFSREISYQVERLHVSAETKNVIYDEYSFLREHSGLFSRSKKFMYYFRQIGIATLDNTRRVYDRKHAIFESARGVRWIAGVLMTAAGIFGANPALAYGGLVLVGLDP